METDYTIAERKAAQMEKQLFVYYESWMSAACADMEKEFEAPRVRQLLADKVVCILDESYEPNQRFVAQYGVDRFPAVVLIHRDGTYHAREGKLEEDELVEFLASAQPSGRQPRVNAQIPRVVDYEWLVQYREAFEKAEREHRPVFLFYKSVISPDSTEALLNVLDRPDVATQFHDTVNCRLDWGHPPNRRLMAKFGITNVPAFVIIRRDGTYHARQGRLSAEELVSFVRHAKQTPGQPAPPL